MEEATAKTKAVSAKERVRKHREALRASGLRPVTRWVPDLRKPEVLAEYRRQWAVLAERVRANPEAEAEYWREAEALQAEAEEGWV